MKAYKKLKDFKFYMPTDADKKEMIEEALCDPNTNWNQFISEKRLLNEKSPEKVKKKRNLLLDIIEKRFN